MLLLFPLEIYLIWRHFLTSYFVIFEKYSVILNADLHLGDAWQSYSHCS